MERENSFEPLFPPQFSHFEQPLRHAQAEIKQIEDEINRLPKDKGLRFELSVPGRINTPYNFYSERKKELSQRKSNVQDSLKYKVDEALKDIDPVTAKKIRETVSIHIGDNDARDLDRQELKQAKSITKDLDMASDFFDKMLSNSRADMAYRKLGIEPEKD